MRKIKLCFLLAAILGFVGMSCQRVPLTNRKQMVGLVSSNEMMQMSFAQYAGFVDTSEVVPLRQLDAGRVAEVGSKIKIAVEDYLIKNGYSRALDGYQWEFVTVKNDQMNAWCMPGGKVCFYTGILPICGSEEGIAVVMGHEIAHAIAEHGRERMSRALMMAGITQVGAIATGIATENEDLMILAGQVLGIGTTLGSELPNSRMQESEADQMGLIFMVMAGYDPNEAVAFWQRMAEAGKNNSKPPQILSTHPADQTRIEELKKLIPKAMRYYEAYNTP